jgi:hypothetical protein
VSTPRGQSLVLLALTMLLLTLMVLITLSFGATVARRNDLNNVADAAAYSQATATARTFNTASLLNRTMVSHYVVMAGVQAQLSYASAAHNYFNLAANQFRMFDINAGAGVPVTTQMAFQGLLPTRGCADRTWHVRDASYDLWHAALSFYARGAPPDNVNSNCVKGNCTGYRDWIAESLGQLEERAAEEAKEVHQSAWDLARIEAATYRNLYTRVDKGEFVKSTAAAAGLSGVGARGGDEGTEELFGATNHTTAPGKPSPTFSRPFAEAVMGTRRYERLIVPRDQMGKEFENLSPLTRKLKAQVDAAFASYPGGQRMFVSFTPGDNSADVSFEGSFQKVMIEEPLPSNNLRPRMEYAFGRYQADPGAVITSYIDKCESDKTRRIESGRSGSDGVYKYDALPMGVDIRSAKGDGLHKNYITEHLDGAHWRLNGGCHGAHDHYGASPESIHALDGDLLPGQTLGFALPDKILKGEDGKSVKGAGGVWGQPVLPVVVTRTIDPAGDPWNLRKFFFGFSRAGSTFDMRAAHDQLTAVSAGIAYYHRRGHLGEPPNMLNPFWHATLVPLEIDARKGGVDPTAASQEKGNTTLETILLNEVPGYADRTEALEAYRALKMQIDGMQKQPQPEAP